MAEKVKTRPARGTSEANHPKSDNQGSRRGDEDDVEARRRKNAARSLIPRQGHEQDKNKVTIKGNSKENRTKGKQPAIPSPDPDNCHLWRESNFAQVMVKDDVACQN